MLSNELPHKAAIFEGSVQKINLIQEYSRAQVLANYENLPFRTTAKIPGGGKSIVDIVVYYYRKGQFCDFLMTVEVTNLRSRSAMHKMVMNKHDMLNQIDIHLADYIRERDKLIPQLEKFTKYLILSRRYLYKSLEINRSKGSGLSESFSNQIRFSREKVGYLDKNSYEMELIGHFPKRFGKHYCIITVFKHIKQKMFRIKFYFQQTLKTFDLKLYFHDVALIMDKFSRQILPTNYPCLEYLASQTVDLKSMAMTVSLLDEDQARSISLREKLNTIVMDDLTTLIPQQRILLSFIWYYIVQKMQVSYFRTMEPLVKLSSFQAVLKQNLLQKYVAFDRLSSYWIEVNVGKTHIDHFYKLLDHTVSPQTILDMELMVSTHHLASDRITSEKVCIRDLLGVDDPLLQKVHNHRFRISDLLVLSKRIYDVVLEGLEKDGTIRFKKKIQENQQISSKIVKILKNPLERLHQLPGVNLLSIEKLYLLESKRMAGTYPITLCSFVLTRSPFKLCTCLLLTPQKLLAVIQNKSSLKIVYKEFDVDYIGQSIPFLNQMIQAGQFDIVAERVRLVLFNALLIDIALDC